MMFQMQAWSSARGEWEPMEDGAAGHVWRPRATAVDAVAKCLAWTGFVLIPAMQVVNLATGDVVWRGNDRYPPAGEPVDLPEPDARVAHTMAKAILARSGDRPPAAPRAIEAPEGQLGLGL